MSESKHAYIKHLESVPTPDYPRPVFELPSLTSHEGNTFIMLGQFLTTLKRDGFKVEADFIQDFFIAKTFGEYALPNNRAFRTGQVEEIVEFMNKFCNLTHIETIEEQDGYIIQKVLKTTVDTKNPSIFKFKNPAVVRSMLLDPESRDELLTPNCYGRNFLYYLPVEAAVSLLDIEEVAKVALNSDVFDQHFFSHKLNLDNFVVVSKGIRNSLKLHNDDLFDLYHTEDIFEKSPFDYLLLQMDISLTKLDENLDSLKAIERSYWDNPVDINGGIDAYLNILNTIKDINMIDSNLGQKLVSAVENDKNPMYNKCGQKFKEFKDLILKRIQKDASKLKDPIKAQEFLSALHEISLLEKISKEEKQKDKELLAQFEKENTANLFSLKGSAPVTKTNEKEGGGQGNSLEQGNSKIPQIKPPLNLPKKKKPKGTRKI